jgi:hypothetical protein
MDLRDIFKINPQPTESPSPEAGTDEYPLLKRMALEDTSSVNPVPQGTAPNNSDFASQSANAFASQAMPQAIPQAAVVDVTQVIKTKEEDFFAPPSGLKDVGLSPIAIQDLLLKCLFYQSNATGKELASKVRLPLHSIVDVMLMKLNEEKLVEVMGTSGLGGFNKNYRLTSSGYNRAQDVLKVSNYIGPAPVSLADYNKAVSEYPPLDFDNKTLRAAYKDLVMSESAIEQFGPAILSGKSMFLYGPAGTGKTSVAERITKCYKSTIKVPYAVNIQGMPVRFFDYFLHKPVEENLQPGVMPALRQDFDNRWIEIRRPCIIVGPEFNVASADLQYDPDGPSYQFPSSIKANGGVFVVDDFGRQKENPEVMLNRWIIPLDKQKDILSLRTGQQVSVPFKVFTVFSTNLDPKSLVDDAFLRRLAYKIKIDFPSLESYCQIFANEAAKQNIKWDDAILDYFIQTHYIKAQRPTRACDPKDILSRASDIAGFQNIKKPFALTQEIIDKACKSYFVGG